MEIQRVKLSNFKGYKDIEFSLSKITLLTGANSSGKSSLLYSILGAIQSGEFPIQFSPNGKFVNMGDFTEIVHNHDVTKNIVVTFFVNRGWDEEIRTEWKMDEVRKLPTLISFQADSKFYKLSIKKIRKYKLDFEYIPDLDPERKFRSPEIIKQVLANIRNVIGKLASEDENPNTEKKKLDEYGDAKNKISFRFNDFDELEGQLKSDGNYFLDNIYSSIRSIFRNYDEKINYISSFRLFPQRTYYETSKFDLKVGKFGENYEDQIILWETNKDDRFKELCKILVDLGLLHDIKSKRLDGGRYEILVQSRKNGIWSSIMDVGFGISQFLPIIVADLQLKDSSTLFIAQPEIHLHPKIQATFGDYLVGQIKKKRKKYVIETHSEYLINRLRLAICKDEIDESDITTLYVDNDSITKTHSIKLLKTGQIEDAPESFFETYMIDVMDIAMNAQI